MKFAILAVLIITLFSAALDAVRDKAFQERAEIYSSKSYHNMHTQKTGCN